MADPGVVGNFSLIMRAEEFAKFSEQENSAPFIASVTGCLYYQVFHSNSGHSTGNGFGVR